MEELFCNIADGKMQVEVKGVAGPACYDVTRALENAIGTVTSDDKTPDYEVQSAQTVGR
jgi:hypothetical protein